MHSEPLLEKNRLKKNWQRTERERERKRKNETGKEQKQRKEA